MAASVRSASTYASSATEASSTVTLPTGWQPGDVCYIGWELTASSGTVTTPSGWTAAVPGFASSGSTSAHHGVLRRVLQSGDTGPAISHTSGRFAAGLVAVQGADNTTPEDVTPTTDTNSGVTYPSVRAPSITPSASNCLLLTFHAVRNGTNSATTTFTPDASETEQADTTTAVSATSNAAIEAASEVLSSNAATGTKTATAASSSGTTINQMGSAIAVRSAAGGSSANLTVAQETVAALTPTLGVALSLPVAQETVNAISAQSFLTTFDDGTTQGWTSNTTGSATLVIDATAAHDGADGAEYNIGNTSDTAWLSHAITPVAGVTVDGWFQVATEGPSGTNIPFCEMVSGGTRIAKAYRQNVTGIASFEYTQTDGVTHTFVSSTLVLATGTWYHFTFTWNIAGTFFFAVNGAQLLPTYTPTGFFSAPSIDTIYLGAERADNPGNWYVDTVTVTPAGDAPSLAVSLALPVAQVNVAALAPTIAGGQSANLTVAQETVTAPAPTASLVASLPVAQETVAAPAPTASVALSLPVAQETVSAPAPTIAVGPALTVAQETVSALAPTASVTLGLPVAQINVSAPPVTIAGAAPSLSLTVAQEAISALAPTSALALQLAAAQEATAALALTPALTLGLPVAQLSAVALPVTISSGNQPPLGPDTGGSASRSTPGGGASQPQSGGGASQPTPGGSVAPGSFGGSVT